MGPRASEVVIVRSEDGFVSGGRTLVALGLVSLLVWVVPMVLLSKKQVELVTSVAGPTGAEEVAPVDPIGRADDLQAQSLLNEAIRVAQTWYAENGTFAGFGPAEAAQFEPSIAFTASPPAPGAVTVRASSDSVVMVTADQGGGFLCAASDLDRVSFGRANAATARDCRGGW